MFSNSKLAAVAITRFLQCLICISATVTLRDAVVRSAVKNYAVGKRYESGLLSSDGRFKNKV